MGWAEIGAANYQGDAIAKYWKGEDGGASARMAAAQGVKLVLAPADHGYLNQKYDPDTLPRRSPAYAWEPQRLWDSRGPGGERIEAPLFSETLTTMADIEYMAFPRLAGIAEIGWSPKWTHAWDTRARLAAQARRWEALRINFFRAPEVPWPAGLSG